MFDTKQARNSQQPAAAEKTKWSTLRHPSHMHNSPTPIAGRSTPQHTSGAQRMALGKIVLNSVRSTHSQSLAHSSSFLCQSLCGDQAGNTCTCSSLLWQQNLWHWTWFCSCLLYKLTLKDLLTVPCGGQVGDTCTCSSLQWQQMWRQASWQPMLGPTMIGQTSSAK